jgi:hypothetical protein
MSVLNCIFTHNCLILIIHRLTMYIWQLIKEYIINSNTDMLIKQQGVTFWGRKNSIFKTTPLQYIGSFPVNCRLKSEAVMKNDYRSAIDPATLSVYGLLLLFIIKPHSYLNNTYYAFHNITNVLFGTNGTRIFVSDFNKNFRILNTILPLCI